VLLGINRYGLSMGGKVGLFVNFAVAAVITGALSAVTYRFVEKPPLRFKVRAARSRAGETPPTQGEAGAVADVASHTEAVPQLADAPLSRVL
jgi:peptidoglycan/LPS O-acetylase OafA/YrhL